MCQVKGATAAPDPFSYMDVAAGTSIGLYYKQR